MGLCPPLAPPRLRHEDMRESLRRVRTSIFKHFCRRFFIPKCRRRGLTGVYPCAVGFSSLSAVGGGATPVKLKCF
jgi:hypothetical protein